MKCVYISVLTLLITSFAQASDQECIAQFQKHVQEKVSLGVPPKHLPRLYLPQGSRQRTVIVFSHGIFESPYFFKGINETFKKQGFISISMLLPGHWERGWHDLDTLSYKEWLQEFDFNIKLAQCFGDKIILAGHSLGGLLALHAVMKHPEGIAGLMMWSPSIKMGPLPLLCGVLGDLFNVNGNIVMGPPDLDETPLYTPNAPIQIAKLILKLYRRPLSVPAIPVFLAYAELDPAVPSSQIASFSSSLQGPKDIMFFPASTRVRHGSIAKFPQDAYRRKPNDYNHSYLTMKSRIENFLLQNFSTR